MQEGHLPSHGRGCAGAPWGCAWCRGSFEPSRERASCMHSPRCTPCTPHWTANADAPSYNVVELDARQAGKTRSTYPRRPLGAAATRAPLFLSFSRLHFSRWPGGRRIATAGARMYKTLVHPPREIRGAPTERPGRSAAEAAPREASPPGRHTDPPPGTLGPGRRGTHPPAPRDAPPPPARLQAPRTARWTLARTARGRAPEQIRGPSRATGRKARGMR
jgi:hypothetical protein